MTKHHVLGARGRIALATMLALIALGPVSSTARSRLAQPHAASAAAAGDLLHGRARRPQGHDPGAACAERPDGDQEPSRGAQMGAGRRCDRAVGASGNRSRQAPARGAGRDRLGTRPRARRRADQSSVRQRGRAGPRLGGLTGALGRLSARRLEAGALRGTGGSLPARLRGRTALACGGPVLLAGTGDLPGVRPLPYGRRRVVSRCRGCALLAHGWHLPGPARLLAGRFQRTRPLALRRDLAAGSHSHEYLGRAAPDRRFTR